MILKMENSKPLPDHVYDYTDPLKLIFCAECKDPIDSYASLFKEKESKETLIIKHNLLRGFVDLRDLNNIAVYHRGCYYRHFDLIEYTLFWKLSHFDDAIDRDTQHNIIERLMDDPRSDDLLNWFNRFMEAHNKVDFSVQVPVFNAVFGEIVGVIWNVPDVDRIHLEMMRRNSKKYDFTSLGYHIDDALWCTMYVTFENISVLLKERRNMDLTIESLQEAFLLVTDHRRDLFDLRFILPAGGHIIIVGRIKYTQKYLDKELFRKLQNRKVSKQKLIENPKSRASIVNGVKYTFASLSKKIVEQLLENGVEIATPDVSLVSTGNSFHMQSILVNCVQRRPHVPFLLTFFVDSPLKVAVSTMLPIDFNSAPTLYLPSQIKYTQRDLLRQALHNNSSVVLAEWPLHSFQDINMNIKT